MLNNENLTNCLTEQIKVEKKSKDKVDIKVLKNFVDTFDPYSPISKNDEKFLRTLNIFSIEDPFKVTNQLIILLEELIEKENVN